MQTGIGEKPNGLARFHPLDIFAQFEANIVRLDAQKLPDAEGGRYVTRFAVSLPPDRAETCLAAIANTAGSLGLDSSAEESVD